MCCKYILELYSVSCFASPKTAEHLGPPLCLFHLPTVLKRETEAQRPSGPQAAPHLRHPVPQLQAPSPPAPQPWLGHQEHLRSSSHSTCPLGPAAPQLPKPSCPPTGGSGEAAGVDANQRSQPRTAVAPRLTHSPKLNTHYTKLIDIN